MKEKYTDQTLKSPDFKDEKADLPENPANIGQNEAKLEELRKEMILLEELKGEMTLRISDILIDMYSKVLYGSNMNQIMGFVEQELKKKLPELKDKIIKEIIFNQNAKDSEEYKTKMTEEQIRELVGEILLPPNDILINQINNGLREMIIGDKNKDN